MKPNIDMNDPYIPDTVKHHLTDRRAELASLLFGIERFDVSCEHGMPVPPLYLMLVHNLMSNPDHRQKLKEMLNDD